MRIGTRTIVSVAATVVALWVGIALAAYFTLPDWEKRGQFGDVFGAVNALFSGLAFAGLILAILLQRDDLDLQRQELSLTRQELARTAEAQVQSEAALRAQASAAIRSSRLDTINFLLGHYKHEVAQMRGIAYTASDPRLAVLQKLQAREERLLQELDSLYREVTGDEQSDNTQDR